VLGADLILHILHYTMQLDIIHIPGVSKSPSDTLGLLQVDLGERGCMRLGDGTGSQLPPVASFDVSSIEPLVLLVSY
jgi:hypothetical protein